METAENQETARQAAAEFEAALRLDPRNIIALQSMGNLAYMQAQGRMDINEKTRRLEDAERWFRALAAADSRIKEAPYTLGVIAWAKAYPHVMMARQLASMKPEDPGALPESAAKNELQARFGPVIHDGIVQLETALAIDSAYDDAMAYLNLLLRLRAALAPSASEYQRDIASADEWVQKALQTKQAKANSGVPPNPSMVMAPPPPPPPPPSGMAQAVPVPQQIRVGTGVQQNKLINAPKPEYPPLARQARIQGVVRFNLVIAKDGTVRHVTLVSGHPLLVPSATEAVQRYVYQPTLLNGEPVEVVTVADVNFSLGDAV